PALRHVQCQRALLPQEEQQPVEPPGLEEGDTPHDGPAGHEAENVGVSLGIPTQLSRRQCPAYRIEVAVWADADLSRNDAEAGVGLEHLRRRRQGTRLPPGVVISEGDVCGVGYRHPQIASQGSVVAAQGYDVDRRE